jgi:hypothetical protein
VSVVRGKASFGVGDDVIMLCFGENPGDPGSSQIVDFQRDQPLLILALVVFYQVIVAEVVRTLVGSIGLVASVPLTTALAVAVVTRSRLPTDQPSSDNGVRPRPSRASQRLPRSASAPLSQSPSLSPSSAPPIPAMQAGTSMRMSASTRVFSFSSSRGLEQAGTAGHAQASGARRDPVDQCMEPLARLDARRSVTNVGRCNRIRRDRMGHITFALTSSPGVRLSAQRST